MNEASDRSIRTRNLIIILAVTMVVLVSLIVWFRGRGEPGAARTAPETGTAESAGMPDSAAAPDAARSEPTDADDPAGRWAELTGQAAQWPSDLNAPEDCDDVREDLARVCAALDLRVPALRGHGGACALLERLSGELASSPPDLSSELRSYDTLLANVFHLFRVAGRERMRAMQRALAEEDLAEPAALALYRWAISHEDCSRPRPLTDSALYSYAGFLFNTLGGQAYLRRRSPRVEALTCFYGLQMLDRAIREGHNPQGLDPRPEIPRCRELVAMQDFVFAERYVAELNDMSRRWESAGSRAP